MPENPADDRPQTAAARARPSRRRRIGMIAFVVLGALTCVLLGWWQLSRWNSTTGSYQNLGYALEWPFFGAFLVFAYRRFMRLEDERVEATTASQDAGAPVDPAGESTATAPRRSRPTSRAQTEIPAHLLPARRGTAPAESDPALAEYNRYLAELHRADQPTDPSSPSPSTGVPRT